MIKKRKKKKVGNAGFTLVELLVAVAVLSVSVAPIMSALVMSSRLNLKGRRKEQAQTVAQNVVEGVKAFGIEKVLEQCSSTYTGDFTIIPDNDDEDYPNISASVVSQTENSYSVKVEEDYLFWNDKYIKDVVDADEIVDGYITVTYTATTYELKLENVLMGSTLYDAEITITPSTNIDYVISYYFPEEFANAGMSNLKYYDVQADVSIHDDTNVLATYNGTFVDQD